MTFTRLPQRSVDKPWGRRDLPPPFGPVADDRPPVGEILFEDPTRPDAELLVKYLFTSEALSIQVHPDEEAARARGLPRGKNEAWYILDADEGAVIGLGLNRPVSPEQLRVAALDGTISDLVDWRPVRSGQMLYAPAGTVHAIGAGISLIEVQQNLDVTYRLFDYGRPRPLQLEEALAVARTAPGAPSPAPVAIDAQREQLCSGGGFSIERWRGPLAGSLRLDGPAWLAPLAEGVTVDGEPLERAAVGVAESGVEIAILPGAELLVCHAGSGPLAL